LPDLIRLYQKHQAQGLQMALITNEDAATAQRFAKQQSLPFPVLIDTYGTVSRQFEVESIPVTVALDKQGRAAGIARGYSENLFSQIETLTAHLLRE
jgi:peroxiredoxin